jgi:outer membrane receptor protein involved in Fe transport
LDAKTAIDPKAVLQQHPPGGDRAPLRPLCVSTARRCARSLDLGISGEAYKHAEASARTRIYGDPTDSRYTEIGGYSLVNATLGFRAHGGWEVSLWAKNLLQEDYLQNVTVQAGNSGLVVGTPSDPRTFGVTVRSRL